MRDSCSLTCTEFPREYKLKVWPSTSMTGSPQSRLPTLILSYSR